MLEPLKGFFRGSRGGQARGSPPLSSGGNGTPVRGSSGGVEPTLSCRPSRGLEEFFTQIRDTSGLTLLDLGGATQKNVSFITDLGHRLYSEDFLRILNEAFDPRDNTVDQTNPGRIEYFLKQTLDYPEGHFDGVLAWDVLEYLNPVLLNAVVERLHYIVRPKAYMLAFFHSDDKLEEVPSYAFRIAQLNSLEILQQGVRRPAQLYNNRSLEKLFGRFESVKFFLTRERLREVIVKV